MKKSSIATLSAACAAAIVLGMGSAAAAVDNDWGSLECAANQRIRVTSSTTTTGSPTTTFAVAHIVNGSGPSWSTPGFHAYKSSYALGSWAISTTGTITGGGAACVAA